MIEMLGVGVPDGEGGWWLHRVCARLPAGQLLAVVTSRLEERQAFLDSVSGRVIPLEGPVWVRGVPVMPESLGRIRMLAEYLPLLERHFGPQSDIPVSVP